MKTILNLIITTLGVLFILSACGGGGVTVGLVNQTCTSNVFSDDCGSSGQATRTKAITDCLKDSTDCADSIPPDVQTCLTDVFSDDCDAVANIIATRTDVTIAELRDTFCADNTLNPNCQTAPSVMETCMNDPFDSDCGVTYNTNRETACRANNTSACGATITRFCETDAADTPANLFDTLCATYDTARENACRDTPTGLACGATITRFCETEAVGSPTNIFNPLCATYNTARETACRGDRAGLDCTSTIAQYCETDAVGTPTNLFNPLCVDMKYNTPREAACRTGSHANLCSATITRYCEVDALTNMDNLFNPLCRDNETAMGVRDALCKDTSTAFTDNCLNSSNMEWMMARDDFCADATNDYANAFTDNCINSNNGEGITARDNFCADKSNNYANPFSDKCINSNNAEGIAPRNEFCGDTANNYANAFNPRCVDNSEGIASRGIVNGDCSDGYKAFGSDCAAAVKADLCIKYPFGRIRPIENINLVCDDDTYATEQEKRYEFCVNDTTEGPGEHELACVEIAEEVCRTPGGEHYNLYARICLLGNYGNRRLIFTNCSKGNTYNLRTYECMRVDNGGSNGTAICTKNPFAANADCLFFNGAASQPLAQANRLLFCRGGNANPADNLDINDPAQVALCVVPGDTSADSVLCRATGEHSNPFSKLCLASGSQFAAERLEFAGYCKNDDTNALAGAVCPDDVTTCLANPFHVDCINEAAYSDFRRPIVNDCETLGAETDDLRCTETIKGCLANPYSVDCMNNRDYDKVRSDLSTKCVMNGQAAETRCSFITAEVCGTNPFADVCSNSTYAEQQKTLANNCIVNSGLDYCAGRVNDCNEDPFSQPSGGYDCKTNVAFVRARQFYCVENPSSGNPQTISLQVCKDFAKEDGNECVLNPYRAGCLAVFFDSGRLSEAQLNRVSYCASGTGSLAIRSNTDENALCRGALDANCTGDLAFLTTGLACFGDSEYQDARNTHLAKCQKAMSARAGVDCDFTADQICQSAESIYTNPFLSVCDEGGRNSLIARQGLIKRCQPLATKTPNCEENAVYDILNECDDRPFNTNCDIYAGDGQAYASVRTDRVRDCGEAMVERGARCNGTQARLCVSSDTAEAAPLSPACDNHLGIKAIRSEFLQACTNNVGVRNCAATIAMNVKMECEDDPWDAAVATAGNSMVSCLDFDFYIGAREMRKTDCTTMENAVGCEGTQAMFCTATGTPFDTILCDPEGNPAHARAQRDFCQIRANVGDNECAGENKPLTRPTTASVLAERITELNAAPTGQTEFLKGTDDGLDTNGFLQADGADAEVITINMATAKYDNVLLGGDTADGIAFFAGRDKDESTLRVEYYAGILAGADLGEALRQESTGATAKWHGAVNWAIATLGGKGFLYHDKTAIGTTTRDFVLEIKLGERTFSSFFQRSGTTFNDGEQGFLLKGKYDATTGVIIDGKVFFGERLGEEIALSGAGATYHFEGDLIGIIGTEGALGVFHAQRSNDGQGDALVGGFVARPPVADYLSWTRTTDALATPNAGDGATNYLRGGTVALDLGTSGIEYSLTLADTYSLEGVDHRIVTLGGQAADGVSFAVNELNGDRLYSGLLSGTNVGAPLVANATYQGRIGILIHKDGKTTYDIDHSFTLNANFGTGSFTDGAANLGGRILTLSGGRFNQFGLISGTIRFGDSRGTLSGLIGAEGVVGSFISTIHTDGAFAGGFVARANNVITTTPPNLRDTAAWQTGAVRADGTTRLTILDTTAEIEGTQGTLRAANFYKHGTGFGSATNLQTETLHLGNYTDALGDNYSLGGDATDGVTFTSATVSSATKRYVGLLSTTSLGNPVSHTDPRATWFGRLALINASLKGNNVPYNADFALIVNFRDRSISSPDIAIPFALLDDGVADELNISGRYDGHGLIRGTVIYKNNGAAGAVTATSGYLSGLIGERGAIGAFVSITGTGANDAYAGGFVAVPFDNRVELAKGNVTPLRLNNYATLPNLPTQLTTSGFLKPASGDDELDVTPTNFVTDHTIDANKIGRRGGAGSGNDDGYHYFTTNTNGSTGYAYGGILSTTDLGAPVPNSGVAAVWTGYFSHYSDITDRNAEFYIDFTAGTLGFANDAGDGVADKTFANNSGGSDEFRLEGQFGSPHNLATGQLGGTVTRIGSSENDSYDILGLIGEEGAVAVFIDFAKNTAGGFTVSDPRDPSYCMIDAGACLVNYADWVNSFATLPPAMLDPNTRRNQFLAGERDHVSQDGTVTSPVNGFRLSSDLTGSQGVSFDGIAQTLGSNNGLDFFVDTVDGETYYYAGIHSQADLGNLLNTTFGGQAKGQWHGRFRSYTSNTKTTDFTLEIDFSTSRIEAFVARGAEHFHLNGSYDANGAITNGTVNYGQFNANTRTPTANRQPNGVLTGIIGQAGAIGVFLSDATGNAGFTGGFIAVPNAVLGADTVAANYNDWIRSFTTRPSIYLDTTPRVSQFLASHSGATALDETGAGTINTDDRGSLNLATATFKGTAFGEDAADGISWFWDATNTVGYAGILSGTDLGAPLSQSGTAKWHGHFQATGGLNRDFLLEIDFDNNPNGIEAFVYHTNANYYHLTGSFGANGVITGKVNYGTFSDLTARTPTDSRADNGILTGLIGADGAVGAFISGTGDKNAITASDPVVHYAGGFVANPTDALDDNVVNYDDWARSFPTLPPVVLDNTATPLMPQFLGTVDGADALDETGNGGVTPDRRGTLTLADSFTDITFAGDVEDGISFFWNNPATSGHAGILAGTNLGAPLTQGSGDPQVRWNGWFHAIIGIRASIQTIRLVFSLEIDFADSNAIEAFVQQNGDYHYHLTGNFDDKGVITGTVDLGDFTTGTRDQKTTRVSSNGFLTGLIGEDGAVGVFLSGTGTKDAIVKTEPFIYAGGFVAHPTATSTANNVKFSTWTAAFSPLAAPTNSGGGGDFVQGGDTALPLGNRSTNIASQGTLSLTDTLNGLAPADGINNGVGFFRTRNNYYAAGLLSGTDLGAPLSNIAQAGEWAGRITAYSNNRVATNPFIVNKVFTLTVTYDGSGGRISAFVRDNSPNIVSSNTTHHFKIDGTYDSKGVIRGEVTVGRFAGGDASATPEDVIAPPAGSLTGLIGERGAVGAFQALQDGGVSRQYGYTGGFVACKRNDADTACK